jgi:hypothetical protein
MCFYLCRLGFYSILIFVLNDANVFSDLFSATQRNIIRKLICTCCKLIDFDQGYSYFIYEEMNSVNWLGLGYGLPLG